MTDCPMCGAPSSGSAFCEKCGTRLTTVAPPNDTPAPPMAGAAAKAMTTGPARRPSRSMLVAGAVGAVLVLAAVGTGIAVSLAKTGDSSPDPAAGATTALTSSASPTTPPPGLQDSVSPSAQDPLNVGLAERNLSCGSGYIVVLASSEQRSPAETVSTALRRFPDAPDRGYLDPSQSCSNMSQLTNKVNQRMFPYMGPFTDAVGACNARMEYADTTTYVIGVDATATAATYCACSYDTVDLPPLDNAQDAHPVGDDVFWTLELQYMLRDAGFNPEGLTDGGYGPRTAGMVQRLQEGSGLSPTGSMDADSWGALISQVC